MNKKSKSGVDISVVLTCHSEGHLLFPAVKSVVDSINLVSQIGVVCELILVADSVDEKTRISISSLSQKYSFFEVPTEVSNPGEARNKGISSSVGKYVSLVDGDDLISPNWLTNAYIQAEKANGISLFHPEFLIAFGDLPGIFRMPSTEHVAIKVEDIIEHNLWASPVFGLREIFTQIRYRKLPGNQGFGPEDWVWNIETMAAGVKHLTVDNSVYLYRTSKSSGINMSHQNSLLPDLFVKEIRNNYYKETVTETETENQNESLQIERLAIRKFATEKYNLLKPYFRPLLSISPRFSRFLYVSARSVYSFLLGIKFHSLDSFKKEQSDQQIKIDYSLGHVHQDELKKLAWIDPSVSKTLISIDQLPIWRPRGGIYGNLLLQIYDFFSEDMDDVYLIFAPWIGVGGADLVTINYAKALRELHPNSRIVIITTEPSAKTRPELVPQNIEIYLFNDDYFQLNKDMRARLLAQLVVVVRPKLVLNVNSPDFYESLRIFCTPMSSVTNLYISFFCFDRSTEGFPIHHAFDSDRNYFEKLSGIFTDNSSAAIEISEITGLEASSIKTHHSPFDFLGVSSQQTNRSSEKQSSLKLLWAHRIDRQKRPDVLNLIAKEIKDLGIDAQIDVYGSSLFMGTEMFEFDESINIRGEFQGGLYGIEDIYSYDAFLVTSEWEGLPTVVLQALDIGLPVISTNVGGVSDVIIANKTGILVDGPEDISGFIRAIELLAESPGVMKLMNKHAKDLLAKNHSWEKFLRSVSNDLRPRV